MRQMITQLESKDTKQNTMKNLGKWKKLIDGILKIGDRKQKVKQNGGVHYSVPNNNWIKLIRQAQKRGLIKLNMKKTIATLLEKKKKLKALDAAGRWNRLTQLLLVRVKNMMES